MIHLNRLLGFQTLIFLILPYFLDAQSNTWNGVALHQNTKTLRGKVEKLPQVKIIIKDQSTATDSWGKFTLTNQDKIDTYAYAYLEGYEWTNREKIVQQIACKEPVPTLQFVFNDANVLFNNYARFYQELINLFNKQKVQAIRRYGEENRSINGEILAPRSGALSLEQLISYYEKAEPFLEYWAKKLSRINLDDENLFSVKAIQSLKNGQISTLQKLLQSSNEAIHSDLKIAYLLVNADLDGAIQLLKRLREKEPQQLERIYELKYFYWLQYKVMEGDSLNAVILKDACDKSQQFVYLVQLVHILILEQNYAEARRLVPLAYNNGKQLLKKNELNYAEDYANLLIDMATLNKSNGNKNLIESWYLEAINILEDLSFKHPLTYDPELIRAHLLLASFYLLEMNREVRAFRALNNAITICQRLSRLYPQLFLDELALAYYLQGAFYFQADQSSLAIEAYALAARYYDIMSQLDVTKLEEFVNTNMLIGQVYYEQLINTKDASLKTKGIALVKTTLRKLSKLEGVNPTSSETLRNDLLILESSFLSWNP